jgi:hypothetical protein
MYESSLRGAEVYIRKLDMNMRESNIKLPLYGAHGRIFFVTGKAIRMTHMQKRM